MHNWERIYNTAFQDRNDVIQWDMQPVRDGQVIKIRFISTNSNQRQGVRVALDKGIEMNGRLYPSIQLWEDTIPEEVVCKCHTDNGLLSIYNMWDKGRGPNSQSFSSGMLVERRGDILIYRCNDIGLDTSFDKLVFTIEMM